MNLPWGVARSALFVSTLSIVVAAYGLPTAQAALLNREVEGPRETRIIWEASLGNELSGTVVSDAGEQLGQVVVAQGTDGTAEVKSFEVIGTTPQTAKRIIGALPAGLQVSPPGEHLSSASSLDPICDPDELEPCRMLNQVAWGLYDTVVNQRPDPVPEEEWIGFWILVGIILVFLLDDPAW